MSLYRRAAFGSWRWVGALSTLGFYRSDCQDDPAQRHRDANRLSRQNHQAQVQIDNAPRAQYMAQYRAANPDQVQVENAVAHEQHFPQ